ncbi:MAG: HIT domain-containing protein [Deltaproteobacteria bacterium]
MELMWAPWRMEYIKKAGQKRGCIFCSQPKIRNRKRTLILAQWPLCYVIMNKYPYISGHLMVVPNRHVDQLEFLSVEEGVDVFIAVQKTIEILKKTMNPQGLNIGVNLGRSAGAGIVHHLHYHVVPRWNGDTNFMPVIGGSKIISESLRETYEKLFPHFQKIEWLRQGN